MSLSTKIAIVTGGASGLGLSITKKFVQSGITTIIIGRNEDNLVNVSAELGDLCHYRVCDLSNVTAIPALVANIVAEYPQIDILVNNAGINLKKHFVEVTDEEFQRIVQTNMNAVFALSREITKQMFLTGSGCIINISSMAAQYGIPYVIAYTAAKTGIEGMTKAMAVELSPRGIRVNCVAPGFIKTNMSAKALDSDPERKQKVMSRTPMGHLGEPEDVAEAVYFLSSDAAKYITGVVLPVDGGNSIGF